VHTLFGPFQPPALHPLPLLLTPIASRQDLFCPLLQFCWRVNISNNKNDIAFLLVWEMDSYTEIPRIASMHMCVTTWNDSSLPGVFTTSWSHSHIDLCHFKAAILALLQWAHQTLSSFGFLAFPYFSCMCPPLIVWPMSNNTTVFVCKQS
jgi:hypothetical protein